MNTTIPAGSGGWQWKRPARKQRRRLCVPVDRSWRPGCDNSRHRRRPPGQL